MRHTVFFNLEDTRNVLKEFHDSTFYNLRKIEKDLSTYENLDFNNSKNIIERTLSDLCAISGYKNHISQHVHIKTIEEFLLVIEENLNYLIDKGLFNHYPVDILDQIYLIRVDLYAFRDFCRVLSEQ